MLAKELYKVGVTRVGLQKINPKERQLQFQLQLNVHDPSPRTLRLYSVEKCQRKKSVKEKITFLLFCKTKTLFCMLLHAFCRDDHGESWWLLVVVVGGVDIAVADNGVLTLGEWLFACIARSFIRTLVPSFVPLFVHSLVRVVVVVGGGGVDIAVDDNGVLTLGEWLFACVARSFVHSFLCLSFMHWIVRSFVCRSFVSLLVCLASLAHSFIRSFVRSLLLVVVLLLLLVVVLISLSTTMEYY
jgi:hypothetical protein